MADLFVSPVWWWVYPAVPGWPLDWPLLPSLALAREAPASGQTSSSACTRPTSPCGHSIVPSL